MASRSYTVSGLTDSHPLIRTVIFGFEHRNK